MVVEGAGHDGHVGALGGQPLGDAGTDAPAGSGDKGPTPGEAGTVELGHGCLLIKASNRLWPGLCDPNRHS
jgi:hypothetical protein